MEQGGFFLRKKPLGSVLSVYTIPKMLQPENLLNLPAHLE
jgi:hypothetical protein